MPFDTPRNIKKRKHEKTIIRKSQIEWNWNKKRGWPVTLRPWNVVRTGLSLWRVFIWVIGRIRIVSINSTFIQILLLIFFITLNDETVFWNRVIHLPSISISLQKSATSSAVHLHKMTLSHQNTSQEHKGWEAFIINFKVILQLQILSILILNFSL